MALMRREMKHIYTAQLLHRGCGGSSSSQGSPQPFGTCSAPEAFLCIRRVCVTASSGCPTPMYAGPEAAYSLVSAALLTSPEYPSYEIAQYFGLQSENKNPKVCGVQSIPGW